MAGRNGAMWAAGQCDSRLHGPEEVAALLRRTLIRLCLKLVFKGGQGSRGAWPGKSRQNSGRTQTCQGQGTEGAVGRCQSQPLTLVLCSPQSMGGPLTISHNAIGLTPGTQKSLASLLSVSPSRQEGPDRLHFAALLLPVLWLLLCSPAIAPPPILAEFHALLPVSFPKLLPGICLILCKAQVFLHGLSSLALTTTIQANETTALQ